MTDKYKDFQKRIISLYIEHPEVKKIWAMLDSRRMFREMGLEEDNDDSPIHMFLMGKSRVGKSQMMKKYVKRNPGFVETENKGTKVDIVPVAYMTLPVNFTLAGFYNQIIQAVGAPRLPGNPKVQQIKDRAFTLLNRQKVQMLIIDEMDYLLASTFVSRQQVMENIKDVSNSANVCLVCVGTPATDVLRKLNDQFIGRFPPVTIPWFKECDDQFFELLISIEEQLAPEKPLNLANRDSALPYLLHELTGGLIGWLKPILREAFKLVGVFDPNFNDFSILDKIDGDILVQAQDNVIGQLSEAELNKYLDKE